LENESQKRFVDNIYALIKQRSYGSLENLSKIAGVNYNTLRSWVSYTTSPRLSMLDQMCNKLGIYTYQLFVPNINLLENKEKIVNSSREKIRINLIKFSREKFKTSSPKKIVPYFGDAISENAFSSYLRTSNGRIAPICKLEIIAHQFGIEFFELLK
jgi:transcriptional regulator with XRE-family HTH domain